ncbi:uncharacterized protein LOC107868759 [Capsicum annuum]|nr:uncharacterized protein LOC107868759 [Capsicum annuum]
MVKSQESGYKDTKQNMNSLHKLAFQYPLLLFCFILFLSPLYLSAAAPLSKPSNTNNAMTLVNKAFSQRTNKTSCINYLKSNPKIMAAAATSKPLDFALVTLQSAVDQAKNTHAYISKHRTAKLSPQTIEAYNSCKTYWGDAASGLEFNLKTIKKDKGPNDTSDYDLKVTLDHGTICATALADARIQDPEIGNGLDNAWLAVGAVNTILGGVKPPKKLD